MFYHTHTTTIACFLCILCCTVAGYRKDSHGLPLPLCPFTHARCILAARCWYWWARAPDFSRRHTHTLPNYRFCFEDSLRHQERVVAFRIELKLGAWGSLSGHCRNREPYFRISGSRCLLRSCVQRVLSRGLKSFVQSWVSGDFPPAYSFRSDKARKRRREEYFVKEFRAISWTGRKRIRLAG